jgi:transposase
MILWDARRIIIIGRMKPPLFVRPLTDDERAALRAGLRSPDAFTLRRCHILLASADGLRPAQIAGRFSCASQSARNAIRAFHAEGLACLRPKSHRPTSIHPEMGDAACERLRALLHRSPRDFAVPRSTWTLATAAEVAVAEAITARLVSDETIRQALLRLGVGWKRAKTWITSPDPAYLRKKTRGTG